MIGVKVKVEIDIDHHHHGHSNVTNHFIITELSSHHCHCHHHRSLLWIFQEAERKLIAHMQQFTHQAGETHLYGLAPARPIDNGVPPVNSTDTVFTIDDSSIASITPNTAVDQKLAPQVSVVFLSPGTATITATGTNELGLPFSSQFQVVVTAAPANATDHFIISELN